MSIPAISRRAPSRSVVAAPGPGARGPAHRRVRGAFITGLALAVFPLGFYHSRAAAQAPADLVRGEAVFTQWCAPCHSAGPGMPGTQALQAKYNGNPPAVLTERADLTPELIAVFVRNGVTVMPFFRKTEISDADLAALGAYIVDRGRSD